MVCERLDSQLCLNPDRINYKVLLKVDKLSPINLILGTINIDLDRKIVLNRDKDAEIWKPPTIDRQETEEVKKFTSPDHQVMYLQGCHNLFKSGWAKLFLTIVIIQSEN